MLKRAEIWISKEEFSEKEKSSDLSAQLAHSYGHVI
jgi:hypothetical protein